MLESSRDRRLLHRRRIALFLLFSLSLLALPAAVSAETLVWLVHSSHTGGHRAAAGALSKALGELPGVRTEVINTMDYLPESMRNLQEKGFKALTKVFPKVKAKSFESSIEGKEAAVNSARRGLAVKAFFSRSFLKRLQEERPHVVVSTHSQSNVILSIWKKHGKIDMPVHSVVTDYATHAMWACPEIDRYYVATDVVARSLAAYGVDPSRIRVTGIPVSPNFARVPRTTTAEARQMLNLDPEIPTITMMGGSLGYGPYVEVAKALEAEGCKVQLLAMTGKNEAVRAELDELAGRLSHVRLETYGFVDRFFRFMDAADAVITKPGGLTVTELLCRGKPCILIRPNSTLESHVAKGILALGIADVCQSVEEGAMCAWKAASDPATAARRAEAIAMAARPEAVFEIAADVVATALD